MSEAFVYAELEAYRLLHGKYGKGTNSTAADIHQAADSIIQLAERIKAERATATMEWTAQSLVKRK